MMRNTSSLLMLLLGSGSLSNVFSQMVEYDLVEMPEYEPPDDGVSMPVNYKVQCPAGGRCYLESSTTTTWGPSEDFRDGGWSFVKDKERLSWHYFLQGAENITLENLFLSSNNEAFISGPYCKENSTCSIICDEDCLCGLEFLPTPECKVKQEYPDLVLPAPTERIIYEFLQDFTNSSDDFNKGKTMQLRCPDFLNGCYLDSDFLSGSATAPPSSEYDGFFAVDYQSCIGDEDATIPCRLGCDPGCSCTLLHRFDNTTEDCTTAPPTMPPMPPTSMPTIDPDAPTTAPHSGTLSGGVGTWGSAFPVVISFLFW